MFKKLFARFSNVKPEQEAERDDSLPADGPTRLTLVALRQAVEQKREEDRLIGAKVGGKVVYQRMLSAMATEQGIHAESLLCALGALAGYACQSSLRRLAVEGGTSELLPFEVLTARDGRHYYAGEPLNQVLIEGKYSFWRLVAEVARQAGAQKLPDVEEIVRHVSDSIDTEAFGIPRLPVEHRPHDVPVRYLEAYWPVVRPIAQQLCKTPAEWPVLFSLAIQEAIETSAQAVSSEMAAKIVMESAVPMSRVDFTHI